MKQNENRPVGDEALREALKDAFRAGFDISTGWLNAQEGCSPDSSDDFQMLQHEAVNSIWSSLASHPTTGQETVATPRDGGVRQALAEVLRPSFRYYPGNVEGLIDACMETVFGLLCEPGSAGPGEMPDMAGWAKLSVPECDHMMRIIGALDDLGEGYLEGAREASGAGEKNYEQREMHANNILLRAANGFKDMLRNLGPKDYFPKRVQDSPKLLTAARDRIRSLENRIAHLEDATPSPAQEPGTGDTGAMADIAAERRRQVEAEGWTPEHDDAHEAGQMAGAAACYALADIMHWRKKEAIDQFWPWDTTWWKPTDRRRNLVKAGALIVAEIERLDRATPATTAETAKGDQA